MARNDELVKLLDRFYQGEENLDKRGYEFFKKTADYIEETRAAPAAKAARKPAPKKPAAKKQARKKGADKKHGNPKQSQHWTKQDQQRLARMARQGVTIVQMSAFFGRSRAAITGKLHELRKNGKRIPKRVKYSKVTPRGSQ